MKTKYLLHFGTLTVGTFWLSTFIAGHLHGNYNHISDTVSELGARGSKSQNFMITATWLAAAFGMVFSIGLLRACKRLQANILPALTTFSIPVSFAWVAIFPAGTVRHPQGGVAMFSLYAGMVIAFLLWKGKAFSAIRVWSLISLALMLLLFLRFTAFIEGHDGLLQRFAHLGWSVWFVSLNISFVKLVDALYSKTFLCKDSVIA